MDNNQNNFPNIDPSNQVPQSAFPPSEHQPANPYGQPQAPAQQPQPYQPQQQANQPQQPYGPYQPAPRKNGKAIAGMVLGIVALVFCWFYGTSWISLGLSITGLALSLGARKETTPETGRGMATAGMICSIVALSLSVIMLITCIACVGCYGCAALGADAAYSYY